MSIPIRPVPGAGDRAYDSQRGGKARLWPCTIACQPASPGRRHLALGAAPHQYHPGVKFAAGLVMNVQSREGKAEPHVPLLALFAVFLRIGAFSFGGGLSGWVYREVVLIRPWMTEEEFLSSLAVSQMLPGTNISNLAVCVGLKRGIIGVVVALCGLLVVPFFAVIGLLALYRQSAGPDWLASSLDGVTAAAIGLLLLIAWKGGKSAIRSIPSALALVATFVMVGILRWPIVPVVVGVGILSVAAAWPRRNGVA